MITRVNKVFIGKYIERTSTLIDNADLTVLQSDAVEGEIAVLDDSYNIMVGVSATYANSKNIYIAEGSSEEFTTTNPDGTALTGRRMLISGAIDGSKIKNYSGSKYAAKVEHEAAIAAITDSVVAGTEYVLRIVYKGDIATQHPGQNIETHRYVAKTGDASADIYNALTAKINKRYLNTPLRGKQKVIVAAVDTGVLEITALPVPSCTSGINDIDELVMNTFEVRLNYVDSDYQWQEVGTAAAVVYTANSRGFGTWETVRDLEKHAQSYEGVSNRTWFPIITPAIRTVKNGEYDMIIVEHERGYRSPDNQYAKETPLTEVVALQSGTGASAPQNAEVLATLNTWMASTPGAFANVSFA